MAYIPDLFSRASNTNGTPESGAKRLVYEAGTTTPVTTYSDRAFATAQAFPVVANSVGVFATSYVPSGNYKIRITDADDNLLFERDHIRVADRPDDPVFFDTYALLLASQNTYETGTFVIAMREGLTFESAASGATDSDIVNAGGQKFYWRKAGYDTVADFLDSVEPSRGVGSIWEAGGFRYEEVASGGHVTNEGGVAFEVLPGADGYRNIRMLHPTGDGATDDNTALVKLMQANAARLDDGTYLSDSSIVVNDTLHQLIGNGYRKEADNSFSGSVIKGGSGVTDLIKFTPDPNDGTSSTDTHRLVLRDFVIDHEGGGDALNIDHHVYSILDGLTVLGGDIGIHQENWTFLTEIKNSQITEWSDTGIFLQGAGSMDRITHCLVGSAGDWKSDGSGTITANYAVRTQRDHTIIEGGQYNTNRDPDDVNVSGWAIWFDNPNTAASNQKFGGGTVKDILFEADQGVRIGTAGNAPWDNVVVDRIRSASPGGDVPGPLVKFENTYGSMLRDPQLDHNNSANLKLVEFGADAVNCGVVCQARLYSSEIVADAAAEECWVHYLGQMTTTERDLIVCPDNIRLKVDKVTNPAGTLVIGEAERINGVWTGEQWSAANDAATSVPLVSGSGVIRVSSTSVNNNSNRQAEIWYDTGGIIAAKSIGSDVAVNQAIGTLSGTTGTDGKLTLRMDTGVTPARLYIENRIGGTLAGIVKIEWAGP